MRTFSVFAFTGITGLSLAVFGIGSVTVQKSGEHLVMNNSFEAGNHRFEIDGVCKMTESSARCWKPDGSPNKLLAKKVTDAIQHPATSSLQSFSVSFLKKRRFAIVKATETDPRYSPLGMGKVYEKVGKPGKFTEGWTEYSGSNFAANERTFSGAEIAWSSIEGTFERGTKEFPLRYEFMAPFVKQGVRKLQIGKFEIDGNSYEILAIGDHPKSGPNRGTFFANGPRSGSGNRSFSDIPPRTDITFRVVSITNPYSILGLLIADSRGIASGYVDDKGISAPPEEVNKWTVAHPYVAPPTVQEKSPYHYSGSGCFDPKYYSAKNPPIVASFYVTKAACKNMILTSTRREIYVFPHIRLEPNR